MLINKKKICLLGAIAVGKTSLISRFVHGIFSPRYLTTVGVKIDKKVIHLDSAEVRLMVWDLAGEDEITRLREEYLRGASGYLLVVDGTRASTLETAVGLHKRAIEKIGPVPFVLVVNKSDLREQWFEVEERLAGPEFRQWTVCNSSALLGTGVEEAFHLLCQMMLDGKSENILTGPPGRRNG